MGFRLQGSAALAALFLAVAGDARADGPHADGPHFEGPPCKTQGESAPKAQGAADITQAAALAAPLDPAQIEKSFNASGAGSDFRCSPSPKPAPPGGIRCIGKVPGYPQPVAILVPPGYRPTAKTEMVLFLHGWNNPDQTLEQRLANPAYDLEKNFAATRRNELLVVPYSRGKCDQFKSNLANPSDFTHFTDQIGKLATSASLSASAEFHDITLAGHSGAWDPIATILGSGGRASLIHEVYLFDSMAGRTDEYANWLRSDPSHRLWTSFMPGNEVTARNHYLFMKDLDRTDAKVPYLKAKAPVPTKAELRSSRVGVVTTDAEHNHAVTQAFAAFLSEDTRPPTGP